MAAGYGRALVLDGVDVELYPGICGLLGPNGAGKTTLMHTLATVLPARRGSLAIQGQAVDGAGAARDVRRSVGYLPQGFGFLPRFTVRELVTYVGWTKRIPSWRLDSAVQRAIERVDLAAAASVPLGKLSGGMVQRAGIAQALVNDPVLMLLDEPTSGLDPEQRLAFRGLLRQLDGVTVMLATHLVEDVQSVCQRVLILQQGRIAFDGPTDELARLGQRSSAEGLSPVERGYVAAMTESRTASG